jgi:divalent metal cation (Fe/Co/Zn/Cd) transporter
MYITKTIEFPDYLKKVFRKACHLEMFSLIYIISTIVFSYSVMSNSQTMKTVLLEDTLGIVPPLAFLISSKLIRWKATKNFPYGFHKSIGIAYLTSSISLLALGVFLLIDGFHALIKHEIPDLPMINFFGHTIWFGYLMITALLWSSIPTTFLGHIKIPLAEQLYDKILYADSKMNKASWSCGFASIIGIIGIGLGYWWADATAGIIISISIINDGYTNTKQSILDLIDEVPKLICKDVTDPLIGDVEKIVAAEDWIKKFKIRFRDDGHIFFGEIFVEPKTEEISIDKINNLRNKIENYHWRLNDIVIMPMRFNGEYSTS